MVNQCFLLIIYQQSVIKIFAKKNCGLKLFYKSLINECFYIFILCKYIFTYYVKIYILHIFIHFKFIYAQILLYNLII